MKYRKDEIDIILSKKFKNDESEKLIVYDGIVDQETFSRAGLLFLLKEAVEKGLRKNYETSIKKEEDFDVIDLREIAKGEAKEQTCKRAKHWKELCYWTEVYKNDSVRLNCVNKCGGNLSEVAIVNIKKVAGPSSTDMKLIDRIVGDSDYRKLLRRQIADINPTMVLCCGTFEQAKKIYEIREEKIKSLCCGVKCFEYQQENRIINFVDFIHPSMVGRDAMKFAFAKEVFNELSSMSITR